MEPNAQRGMIRRFLHNWQELIVWLPILLAVLVGLWWLLPRLDPRSGIDGFGDLYQLTGALVALAVIWFVAWLAKRTYGTELSDDQVATARAEAINCGSWTALGVLAIDLAWWICCVVIAYLVLRS